MTYRKPERRTPGDPPKLKYRGASAPGKPSQAYCDGWERIFGQKPTVEHTAPGEMTITGDPEPDRRA